jgi:acyl carrier protein
MSIQLLRSPEFALKGGARQPAIDAGGQCRDRKIGASSMLFRPASLPESKIADVVHQLLRGRSIDREFAFEDNLRDVGLTSLDMTSLVLAVEAEFSIRIPDRAITPANFMSVATIGRLVAMLSDPDGVAPLTAGVAGGY